MDETSGFILPDGPQPANAALGLKDCHLESAGRSIAQEALCCDKTGWTSA
jgi:hypothetical protein